MLSEYRVAKARAPNESTYHHVMRSVILLFLVACTHAKPAATPAATQTKGSAATPAGTQTEGPAASSTEQRSADTPPPANAAPVGTCPQPCAAKPPAANSQNKGDLGVDNL